PLIANVRTVSGCIAHCMAAVLKNMSDQAGGRRFAVGSGDRDDRNTGWRARREKHIEDMFGDISPDALARGKMHAKARCGINLDNASAVLAKRFEIGRASCRE